MLMLILMSRLCQDSSARPIIVKFQHRPERRDILRKKKEMKNGINVSEDLVVEDRKRKLNSEIQCSKCTRGDKDLTSLMGTYTWMMYSMLVDLSYYFSNYNAGK